jgi:hypothetical protein
MSKWVCHLKLLLVLAGALILGSESHGTRDDILLSQIRDRSNLWGQVSVFRSLRNSVAQLYPQALGFLWWLKSESESHCDWRSARLSVLMSSPVLGSWPDISYCLTLTVPVIYFRHGLNRNIFTIIACSLVARGTCPHSCSLATAVVL